MAPEFTAGPTTAPQAGEGFNEAGANWPRNLDDLENDENVKDASMRPGPIGPGINGHAVFMAALQLASMRPGQIGPGIAAPSPSAPACAAMLQ